MRRCCRPDAATGADQGFDECSQTDKESLSQPSGGFASSLDSFPDFEMEKGEGSAKRVVTPEVLREQIKKLRRCSSGVATGADQGFDERSQTDEESLSQPSGGFASSRDSFPDFEKKKGEGSARMGVTPEVLREQIKKLRRCSPGAATGADQGFDECSQTDKESPNKPSGGFASSQDLPKFKTIPPETHASSKSLQRQVSVGGETPGSEQRERSVLPMATGSGDDMVATQSIDSMSHQVQPAKQHTEVAAVAHSPHAASASHLRSSDTVEEPSGGALLGMTASGDVFEAASEIQAPQIGTRPSVAAQSRKVAVAVSCSARIEGTAEAAPQAAIPRVSQRNSMNTAPPKPPRGDSYSGRSGVKQHDIVTSVTPTESHSEGAKETEELPEPRKVSGGSKSPLPVATSRIGEGSNAANKPT